MREEVNTPRRYDSTKRREAARATRHAILVAARALFLERGYAAATMPAIAKAAGVNVDTIYATIGRKPDLARLVLEAAISGEDEAIPALQRAYVREIQAEPDPRRKLARYARAVREILARVGPIVRVLKEGALAEPGLAALWAEIGARRAANMRLFVAELAAAGPLREGLSIDQAADIVWATNSPELYDLLVGERGWTPEQFEAWLADAWARLLLADG
jgi:AcrR family transcriptional regulator